jgi:hypothetical protein
MIGIAACGDNGANRPDACTAPLTYPEEVALIDITLTPNYPVALDGNGTLCDQMVRSLIHPVTRHPMLAELDATSARGRCQHDDLLDREIVDIDLPEYGGLPNLGTPQQILAHVDKFGKLVYLAAIFIPQGHIPAGACANPEQVVASVPGNRLSYQRFDRCNFEGDGEYEIAPDDEIIAGAEGVMLDVNHRLRRVTAVQVFLLGSHVTETEINSTLFCCDPGTVKHCVGGLLYVDSVTGELVKQAFNCITC